MVAKVNRAKILIDRSFDRRQTDRADDLIDPQISVLLVAQSLYNYCDRSISRELLSYLEWPPTIVVRTIRRDGRNPHHVIRMLTTCYSVQVSFPCFDVNPLRISVTFTNVVSLDRATNVSFSLFEMYTVLESFSNYFSIDCTIKQDTYID